MSLADAATRCPRPFDAAIGRDAVPGWARGRAADLIAGAAGCSPYLAGLIAREADWLEGAMDAPEAAMRAAWDLAADRPDLGDALRGAKRRVALITALADLAGVWPLETVTGALSDFADRAVDLALAHALAPLLKRGKLPGLGPDDLATFGGLTVFAMGKMGAGELNYSSDIDLICLFDETRHAPGDYPALRSGFARAVRQMCATLSEIGPGGYVFRTDLRLRPDPSVTPVALSMGAAERYYESLGRTWERAAWIKARPAAGDIAAGAAFGEGLRPFVWRKHLDFAAIEDAHNMRLAIRDAKGLAGPITLPGHDMKLGRGGIREIEFFTQTRQLIAGGRDPALRCRGTVDGLARLADAGWIQGETATALTEHYRFHRTVEHRVQMVQDAQTHALPRRDAEFDRLAAMMDRDRDGLMAEIRERLEAVHAIAERFFAPSANPGGGTAPATDILDAATLARWAGYPAFRSPRAQAVFDRMKPMIAERLGAAARPEEARAALDGFLAGLPAGVQLFSLFEANPQLVDLLLDVVTVSPALAEHLARNAQVLDAVIGGSFFAPWPGEAGLRAALDAVLDAAQDYEAVLDAARRWAKEWHFRVGVHHLRGLSDAIEAGTHYADLARVVVKALWPHVVNEFARRHGPWPGRGAVILGMGSLGAGWLAPDSDLDMIVIYDPGDATESAGPRPLAARMYFARLTQAMVTALAARTAEGRLYEVDMRLRPSGNQGPVATSWAAFRAYQQDEAWLWEHLALTRARVVAGPEGLASDVNAHLAEILARPRDRGEVIAALREMRARIAEAKGDDGPWQAKTGPGQAQDVALFAQGGALLRGVAAHDIAAAALALPEAGLTDANGATHLAEAYRAAMRVQMARRLIAGDGTDPETLGQAARDLLTRAVGAESLDIAASRLQDGFQVAARIIDQGLAEGRADGGDGKA